MGEEKPKNSYVSIKHRQYTGDNLEITIGYHQRVGFSLVYLLLTPNEAHELMEKLAIELGMSTFKTGRRY